MTTYQHYKGGTYKLICEAIHSETQETLIIYEQLYQTDKYPKGTRWARPKKMFYEEVQMNGERQPRFRKI